MQPHIVFLFKIRVSCWKLNLTACTCRSEASAGEIFTRLERFFPLPKKNIRSDAQTMHFSVSRNHGRPACHFVLGFLVLVHSRLGQSRVRSAKEIQEKRK